MKAKVKRDGHGWQVYVGTWANRTNYGRYSSKGEALARAAEVTASLRRARNPGGRKLTKLQRKVRAAKKAADRRVAVALAKYLKQENPGRKIVGAKVSKGKGGRRTIVPIYAKRGKR